MEINKAPVSSQYLTSLLGQRAVTGLSNKVDAVAEPSAANPEKQEPRGRVPTSDDLRLAREAFEGEQADVARRRWSSESTLNTRARMALDAYTTQENLVQDDARLSLREMLGVDYYA